MDAGQSADGVESEHHYHNLVRGSTYTCVQYLTMYNEMWFIDCACNMAWPVL